MIVTTAQATTFIRGLEEESTELVESVIRSADSMIASWLRWPVPDGAAGPTLVASTYTDYERAQKRSRILRLRVPAVISVTSAHMDATGDFTGSEVEVVSTEISLRGRNIRRTGGNWSSEPDGNRIIYRAGFEDTIPEAVRTAVLLCIRELWIKRLVFDLPAWTDGPVDLPVVTPEIKTLMHRWARANVGPSVA